MWRWRFPAATIIALAPVGAARAEPFGILNPARPVAYVLKTPAPFRGMTGASPMPGAMACRDTACADVFRHERVVIWSGSANSTWFLLPPKRLGAAAALRGSATAWDSPEPE